MKYLLALLLLLPSTAWASCKDYNLDKIGKFIGIPIHCDFQSEVYFDAKLKRSCDKLSAKDPTFSETEYLSYTIMKFAKAYPKEVITKYLHNIYFLSELHCDDLRMGGTISGNSIYLSSYYYTPLNWYAEALHHEFSSILWRENYSLMPKYAIGMISGYAAYDTDSLISCLNNSNCRTEREDLLRQGFLCDYNRTNIENDFNVYSEYLFLKKEHLMELANRYPLVDKKVKLFKKFYADIGIPL